jgi:adenosylcobinamide-GDP ribazoletransferase
MVPAASAAAGAVLGLCALGIGLGPAAGFAAFALIAAGGGLLGWLCLRQIGGQTGDVLGALEQFGEVSVLLAAIVAYGWTA